MPEPLSPSSTQSDGEPERVDCARLPARHAGCGADVRRDRRAVHRVPILTLLYDEKGTGGRFAGRSITTSALQRLGIGQSGFRRLLPMYPIAASRMTAPDCDVLVSSSSAFAHGIHVQPGRPARLLLPHAFPLRVV